MKWWAFNEEQLKAALAQWAVRRTAELGQALPVRLVTDFLDSPEVRAQKMRGDQ